MNTVTEIKQSLFDVLENIKRIKSNKDASRGERVDALIRAQAEHDILEIDLKDQERIDMIDNLIAESKLTLESAKANKARIDSQCADATGLYKKIDKQVREFTKTLAELEKLGVMDGLPLGHLREVLRSACMTQQSKQLFTINNNQNIYFQHPKDFVFNAERPKSIAQSDLDKAESNYKQMIVDAPSIADEALGA
ncbi:hypothetical protein [uncultured Psychromonas sp.]|uniref:hypothetical protein n=1 Tax=uncultured Psychromonas sp. TaxID=173974 RepID=UPI0026367D49|nr:hypothetical protein [uncultured Psychromonas sp.]